MHDPVGMQVLQAVQELPHEGFESVCLKHRSHAALPVEPQHLVQIVLRIVEGQRQAGLLPTSNPKQST